MKKPGWGVLSGELKKAQTQKSRVIRLTGELDREVDVLSERIALLNQARISRVGEILDERKQRICLLHSRIFTSMPFEELLRPKDDVVVVLMSTSWTAEHRIGDSDATTNDYSGCYHTTACSLCRDVVSKGSFTRQPGWVSNTMMRDQPEISTLPNCEKFYTLEILDKVSVLFGMQPVTRENVDSIS
jgi:hypothetical protein